MGFPTVKCVHSPECFARRETEKADAAIFWIRHHPCAGYRSGPPRRQLDDRDLPFGRYSTLATNKDGRTDTPVIAASDIAEATYELVFHAGDYLSRAHGPADGVRFLDVVPIRFGISDASQHYHVPLLLSPFGYSTYRGS